MRRLAAVIAIAATAALAVSGCGVVNKVKNSAKNAEQATKDFEARQKKRAEASYRVVYKGEDGKLVTYSQAPPKAAFITEDSKTVTDGAKTYECTSLGTPDVSCTDLGSSDLGTFFTQFGGGFLGAGFAELLSATPLDSEKSTRTIAGREADCVKVKQQIAGFDIGSGKGSLTTCYDRETAAVLFASSTDDDGKETVTVEATEFGAPKDSDFELPVEAKTLQEQMDDATSTTESRTTTTEDSTTSTGDDSGSSTESTTG